MRHYIMIIVVILVFCLGTLAGAQDDADETPELPILVEGWLVTDLAAEAEDETESRYVMFLSLDDGAVLIEVAHGVDLVYTRGEDGLYSGVPLIPSNAYESEITLEIIDEDTRRVDSITEAGIFTLESHLVYERTDIEYGVWMEDTRDLSEYSMFGTCLGVTLLEPPRAWVNPDPIVQIRIDSEAGVLYIGNTMLEGGGSTYELVTEQPFGQFTQVITQTATVSEHMIALSYHAIAGGRDDCELIYEAIFVPFDGDYEALFSRAEEIGLSE